MKVIIPAALHLKSSMMKSINKSIMDWSEDETRKMEWPHPHPYIEYVLLTHRQWFVFV